MISNRKSALLSELQNHLRFTCVALTVNRIRLMLAALAATFLILAAIKTMIGCETIASLGSGRQRLMAVAIALALLLPADVRSQTAPQTHSQVLVLSFQYSSRRASLLVQVSINGKRALLLLDTGSAHTIVRPELVGVRHSQLKPAGPAQSGTAFIGDAVGAEVSLQVGSQTLKKYRVVAMDLSQILSAYEENLDGVLGLDFLHEFSRIEIDFHKQRIELQH